MSIALERLRATRRLLLIAVSLNAIAWAAAAGLGALATMAIVDALAGLPLGVRDMLRPAPLLAAGLAASSVAWRDRAIFSLAHVALWVEERVPWLRYALVTAADPRHEASRPLLEPLIGEAAWGAALVSRATRRLRVPVAGIALALAAIVLLPPGAVARVRAPTPGDALDRVRRHEDSGTGTLSPLVADVTPPAYTGERPRTIEEPILIPAPVGSRIILRGRGPAATVSVSVDARPLEVSADRDRWMVTLSMPERPAVVRLERPAASRLVALEPRADSAPIVVLSLPRRDTVLAAPAGHVPLVADARDDYGLADIAFEYIVSSGEGEQFTFRQGRLGARNLANTRREAARAELALEALELGPGDVVHLRAIARDANVLSGPATGVSETRAIRIARIGEQDSIAIEGAPPPEPDRAALSQRMLIILTETLEARRPRLERDVVVSESRALARDQARLRRQVGEIVFTRLGDDAGAEHVHGPGDGHDHSAAELERLFRPESLLAAADRATGGRAEPEALDFAHGESPVLAINRPLLAAYNHMWDAGRELEVGEPGRALPPMRRALDALQEARAAERYFLRGRPPRIVVDIDRVRLARAESVTPADRERRHVPSDGGERYAARYTAAIGRLAENAQAGLDSLLVLRIEALADAPALAHALGDAIESLRRGRDATVPLLRARRAIDGSGADARPLGRWSVAW